MKRPRVGDTCWFVEWCVKLGLLDDDHPEYGGDPDRNETREQPVATREEAERLAREVYPQDKYGAVRYWPAEFVAYDEADALHLRHVGFWKATGEVEHYEGDG